MMGWCPSQVNPDLLVGTSGAPHFRFVLPPGKFPHVTPRMRVGGCRTDALVVPENWVPQRQQPTTRKKKVEGFAHDTSDPHAHSPQNKNKNKNKKRKKKKQTPEMER